MEFLQKITIQLTFENFSKVKRTCICAYSDEDSQQKKIHIYEVNLYIRIYEFTVRMRVQ
jgi:hypothetical protein